MKILGFNIQRTPKAVLTQKVGSFDLITAAPNRSSQDINDWINAVKSSENIYLPSRKQLYEIYFQTVLDDDYVTTTEKRKANILNLNLVFKRDDQIDEKVTAWINTIPFRQFKNDLMDTIFWGHSLFEFDYSKDFFNYVLIPRININPERKIVMKTPWDMTGIPYLTDEYKNLLLEVMDSNIFGLLRVISIYAIYKRNMMGDWANYSELAGNNFRMVKYTGSDTNIRSRVVSALENAGSGGVVNLPEGVEVDFINQSSASANALFEGFHKRMSDAIIRLILGQTITTTDTQAAYARATIAKEVEDEINSNDRCFMLDVLNEQFREKIAFWGFDTDGDFVFEESDKTPFREKLENDKILNEILKDLWLPDEYILERYAVNPKPEEATPTPTVVIPSPEGIMPLPEDAIEISNPYNEHAARLIHPGKFDKFRRTKGGTLHGIVVPSSISIIWGHLKGRKESDWAAQSLRFSKIKWSGDRAKKWLTDNQIKYITFEPAV